MQVTQEQVLSRLLWVLKRVPVLPVILFIKLNYDFNCKIYSSPFRI